jgi:hypothetical protein
MNFDNVGETPIHTAIAMIIVGCWLIAICIVGLYHKFTEDVMR